MGSPVPVQDAVLHAEDDKTKPDLVHATNKGDALLHRVRKLSAEHSAKLGAADRQGVDHAVVQAMDTEPIERPVTRLAKATTEVVRFDDSGDDGRRLDDRQLWMMASAFAQTGGMPRVEDVARLMQKHHDQPLALVARWISARSVISVAYGAQTRPPLVFQFD